eukprot:TRINITY_DN20901_c0_g1_i1.p1 TRINITY_DN20901_c0_g1~~TRINITY_DN20901_c0_g1_i1.p1  ORF type:complete len:112 (+),score=30.75 TRINITY_DN20901_c0_g1_i1:34-336(+)
MIEHVPGGRRNMLISVRLGVPPGYAVHHDEVRATFPYGQMLPIEVVPGGLTYPCGRVVPELGDAEGDDTALVVCAAVSIGYHDPELPSAPATPFSTSDGH